MKITGIKSTLKCTEWDVLSDSGKTYRVKITTMLDEMGCMYFKWTCNCPSRKSPCKHIIAVDEEYPPLDDEVGERCEY